MGKGLDSGLAPTPLHGRPRCMGTGPQPKRLHPTPPGSVDERTVLRRSHENPVVQRLYDEFLERPNSHKASRGP